MIDRTELLSCKDVMRDIIATNNHKLPISAMHQELRSFDAIN